jgi:hypothetical protein
MREFFDSIKISGEISIERPACGVEIQLPRIHGFLKPPAAFLREGTRMTRMGRIYTDLFPLLAAYFFSF